MTCFHGLFGDLSNRELSKMRSSLDEEADPTVSIVYNLTWEVCVLHCEPA